MMFLLALEGLLITILVILISALASNSFRKREFPLVCCLGTGTVAFLLALGLTGSPAVRADAVNYTPICVFACGVLGVWGFSIRIAEVGGPLVSVRKPGYRINPAIGFSCLALAASIYLTFTALDHWTFFRDAGVIAAPQVTGINDVNCPMALFRIEKTDAVYRCPTSFVFKRNHTEPFVPWPTCASGRSKLLKDRYKELADSL